MFRNFLKSAWRNLIRDKAYVSINVLGLSVGIAATLIIGLYIHNELSYDRFHADSDKIYRVYIDGNFGKTTYYSPLTANVLKETMLQDFGEVEMATRIFKVSEQLVVHEKKKFMQKNVMYADKDFFNLFSFHLLSGDAENALDGPNKLVVTESMAQKLFGTQDPIGKVVKLRGDNPFTVTGVCEDVPQNSHFHFSMLLSYASAWQYNDTRWINANLYTYIKLKDPSQEENLEKKLPELIEKYVGPEVSQVMGIDLEQFAAQGNTYNFLLQPLESIYLHSDFNDEIEPVGDISRIYYFSIIALFILLIACINFMNLATAKYANRAKEVGIRKVVGSQKRQLVMQFLTESILLSLVSLIIAIAWVEISLPYFNQFANKTLSLPYLEAWYILPALLMFSLLVGIMAGTYPAFYMSRFSPQRTLKGKVSEGTGSGRLRAILVTTQFIITITLFISTAIIFSQNRFMITQKLGFAKEQVLVLEKAYLLGDRKEAFLEEVNKLPEVVAAAFSHKVPGQEYNGSTMQIEGRPAEDMLFFAVNYIGPDYVKAMNMELVAGREFSKEFANDQNAVIINQTAAKKMRLEEPLGKYMRFAKQKLKIIGVLKDFHFESLHKPVRALVLRHHNDNSFEQVVVRMQMKDAQRTLKQIEKTWSDFKPDEPMGHFFLDQAYDHLYNEELRTARIFVIFSILAIVIACLGLLGLSAFMAEKRSKEIGIRKVMGARIPGILQLLYREVLLLLLFATIVAWPLSYYLMKLWLQNFAFHINMSFVPFVVATLVACFIAIFTTSFQALKAAHTNPSDTLRDE